MILSLMNKRMRKHGRAATLLLCFACFCFAQISTAETQETTSPPNSDAAVQSSNSGSKILYGKVGATQLPGGLQTSLPVRLERPAMPALDYKAERARNNLLNADLKLDMLKANLQSGMLKSNLKNNILQSELPKTDLLKSEQLKSSILREQGPSFFSSISKTAQFLSSYDIEIIVDKSMSMRKQDCPGMLSRWQWCGMQSQQLGQQLAAYAPQGVTITPFAGNYDVYEHQSPAQVATVFESSGLQFGTRLAEPLADRLQSIFSNRNSNSKPTIIAIITDGVPHPAYEPRMVAEVLINASKQMRNPNELSVVFFQIGAEDRVGLRYLKALDNDLVSWGANYHFVHTVTFDHLQEVGLSQALVDSIHTLDAERNRR